MSIQREELIKINEFLDLVNSDDYAWNDAIDILSKIMVLICENNVDDIVDLKKIIIDNTEEDVCIKIYVT
jgi:hypothetical protein